MTSLLDLTKTPILLWKHPTITSCFILKIGEEQQLIGFIRTDKNGIIYWKFQVWSAKKDKAHQHESTN